MANLVKSRCVVRDEDTCVIDSNELIAEKIKKYMAEKQEEDGNYVDEFSELLDADKVERLLEDREEVLETVSQQEIIEQAQAEAEAIIRQAQVEADIMKKQLFANAEKEGYNAGYAKGIEEADKQKQQLLLEKQQLEADYAKELEKMEPLLVDTLIEIFEEVFQIQFAEKREFVMHLLQGTLNKLEGSKDYLIRVSKEDFEVLTEKKNEIQMRLPRNSALEIVEDLTLVKNQCLIETDGGVFDCSLDTQMESLVRDLRTLASL